jgi:hypothetical protein
MVLPKWLKTMAITSKLTIIVASAATSMVESGAMLHCWWQSSGSVDLDHPRSLSLSVSPLIYVGDIVHGT